MANFNLVVPKHSERLTEEQIAAAGAIAKLFEYWIDNSKPYCDAWGVAEEFALSGSNWVDNDETPNHFANVAAQLARCNGKDFQNLRLLIPFFTGFCIYLQYLQIVQVINRFLHCRCEYDLTVNQQWG